MIICVSEEGLRPGLGKLADQVSKTVPADLASDRDVDGAGLLFRS